MRVLNPCLAGLLCVGLVSPAMAEGDPKPSLLDLITIDRVAESLASIGISALRTQMEVEYQHLQTDLLRGTMAITGVTLRPQLPHDRARQCEITVQRIGLGLGKGVEAPLGVASFSGTMVGASANIACLPREMGLPLRAAGYASIDIDRLSYEVDYVHGTGEIRANGTAAINDMAVLDMEVAGAILPRLGRYGGPGDPAIRVRRAVIGLQDQGGWQRLSSQIPENLRQPAVIQSLGTEALTSELGNNGTRALSATETRFIDDLMTHVAGFVENPGEITIEAQLPAAGIVLEPEVYQTPEQLLQALAPDVRTAPVARSQYVPSAVLARLGGDLSTAERLEVASALLTGAGVPRAEALVPGLLAPVLDAGGAEAAQAALLSAQAQAGSDPAAAYRTALLAASGRQAGAIALLDRLEARLTTGDVLAAQAAHLDAQDTAPALPEGGDIRALRAQALAYFTGLGAPRSYAQAYYLTLIAEAAGDIGATPLREDIEARFANRGDAVRDAWAELRAGLQARALNDWIAKDLATRFAKAD